MRTPDPEPSPLIPHPRSHTRGRHGIRSHPRGRPSAADLTPSALARALKTGLTRPPAGWGETAAVDLLIAHGSWLTRPEFRAHVALHLRAATPDDVPLATALLDWPTLATSCDEIEASDLDRAVLRLACHLAGWLPGGTGQAWPLARILRPLDATTAVLAARAVAMAALGPDTVGPL